jgi:hypothetical protein
MALTPAQSIPDAPTTAVVLTRRSACLRALLVRAVLVAAGGGLFGCRGNSGPAMIAANNDTNLKRLGTLYGFFQLRNEFRGPRDEAEFRAFITAQDARRLALAGVSPASIDTLFVSERDRLPFRIRFGVDTRVRGPALPVVFEQEGLGGRQQVGFTGGAMEEVDAATYESLWSDDTDRGSNADPPRGRGF